MFSTSTTAPAHVVHPSLTRGGRGETGPTAGLGQSNVVHASPLDAAPSGAPPPAGACGVGHWGGPRHHSYGSGGGGTGGGGGGGDINAVGGGSFANGNGGMGVLAGGAGTRGGVGMGGEVGGAAIAASGEGVRRRPNHPTGYHNSGVRGTQTINPKP
jgi:hypothetical protein